MMSNLQHLAMFMALIFLPMVISRECYGCTSEISLEDCDYNRTIVMCKNSSQPCATFSGYTLTGEKQQFHLRGCAHTCSASDIADCVEPSVKCALSCCSSDLCNYGNPLPSPAALSTATDAVVSGLLLIVTTSFMYLFGF